MNQNKVKEEESLSWKELSVFIVIIVGLVGGWIASPYIIGEFASDWPTKGTIGDSYGAVNALFSGLAFAGVIFAIILQRKELRFQRKELEETRGVFETQSEIMRHQQYEATFFRLLDDHRKFVQSLETTVVRYTSSFGRRGNSSPVEHTNSGYERLEATTSDFKVKHEAYMEAQRTNLVTDSKLLLNHPDIIIKYTPEIKQTLDGIWHIIQFVTEQLRDDVFYHKTLFQALSIAEKLLFGFAVHSQVERGLLPHEDFNFDYKQEYSETFIDPFDFNKTPFPHLFIDYIEDEYWRLRKDDQPLSGKFLFNNYDAAAILIKTAELSTSEQPVSIIPEEIVLDSGEGKSIEFRDHLLDFYSEKLKSYRTEQSGSTFSDRCKFSFDLKYLDREFRVVLSMAISIQPSDEDDIRDTDVQVRFFNY